MNICVTLNPCLDKSLVVPPWQPGQHQVRGRSFDQVVGGKGVNVARGLKRLNLPARPALFLGGEMGRLCHRLLCEQDGFDPLVAWTLAPTREILTVRTADTADQTAFFDPNPEIRLAERDELARQIRAAFAAGADWCCMSGSSPGPVTDGFYAMLVQCARQSGIRTLVDTYGDCLGPALEAGPHVVKMNRREYEEATGRTLDTPASICEALAWIRDFGVSLAIITFGPRGMVAAWDDQVQAWRPPRIDEVNPIGAGDAMTAGLVDALRRKWDPAEACRWGMACAVSSVQRWIACDFDVVDAKSIYERMEVCGLTDW